METEKKIKNRNRTFSFRFQTLTKILVTNILLRAIKSYLLDCTFYWLYALLLKRVINLLTLEK